MGPLANSDKVLLKGRSPEWIEFLEHPNYDAYWQARNTRPHLKNVHCAVMTVGGWYDAEDLFGALETYRWTERQNPGITNILVMGPWAHGGWSGGDGDHLFSRLRRLKAVSDFCQSEIKHLYLAATGEEEVGRLDVAMHDANLVGGFEGAEDGNGDVEQLRQIEEAGGLAAEDIGRHRDDAGVGVEPGVNDVRRWIVRQVRTSDQLCERVERDKSRPHSSPSVEPCCARSVETESIGKFGVR